MFKIVLLLLFVFQPLSLAGDDSTSGVILAFGDIRGHIEPCGCDPRTDVGGVRRLSAAIGRYRNQTKGLTVLNLGNIAKPNDNSPTALAISSVIANVKPDVSLVNTYEWKRYLSGERLPEINWVLSNQLGEGSQRQWVNVHSSLDYEVFGYLGIADRQLSRFGPKVLARWKSLTKKKVNQQRILLFSGTNQELTEIVRANFFGTIIRSSLVPLGVEIGDKEQNNERVLTGEFAGKLVWSVPYGGAGLLRLNGLEKHPTPKPLAALFDKVVTPPKETQLSLGRAEKPSSLFNGISYVHWLRLDEESGVSPAVLGIFDNLRKSNQDQFQALASLRMKDLSNTDFVGAEACAGCHASSYEVWKKSRHARAITTLIDKSRHQDAYCVECHVLGFTSKGGYVNQEVTPHFSNVQCENCHGPRRLHIQAPTVKLTNPKQKDPKKVCAECHTPPHSPGFDEQKYWKTIEHK